jgi:hypothetical protein
VIAGRQAGAGQDSADVTGRAGRNPVRSGSSNVSGPNGRALPSWSGRACPGGHRPVRIRYLR